MRQRVFLVDDDEDDQFFAKQTIDRDADCEISFFDNGEELINHMKYLTKPTFPTLVLMDLNMPRMNGLETLQVLKTHQQWQSIPVIILTTSTSKKEKEKALALGASDFLSKPEDFQRLTKVLASVSSCWKE